MQQCRHTCAHVFAARRQHGKWMLRTCPAAWSSFLAVAAEAAALLPLLRCAGDWFFCMSAGNMPRSPAPNTGAPRRPLQPWRAARKATRHHPGTAPSNHHAPWARSPSYRRAATARPGVTPRLPPSTTRVLQKGTPVRRWIASSPPGARQSQRSTAHTLVVDCIMGGSKARQGKYSARLLQTANKPLLAIMHHDNAALRGAATPSCRPANPSGGVWRQLVRRPPCPPVPSRTQAQAGQIPYLGAAYVLIRTPVGGGPPAPRGLAVVVASFQPGAAGSIWPLSCASPNTASSRTWCKQPDS